MKRADLKVGMVVALVSASRDRYLGEPHRAEVLEIGVAPDHRKYGKPTGVRILVEADEHRDEYEAVVQPARLVPWEEARAGYAARQVAARPQERQRQRREEQAMFLARLAEWGISASFGWGSADRVEVPVSSLLGHLDRMDSVVAEVHDIHNKLAEYAKSLGIETPEVV
jgi:hypothetical protein